MGWVRRAALCIGLGALFCASATAVVHSTSLRASFTAAYRAFRDPGLLDRPPPEPPEAALCAPPLGETPRALAPLFVREFEPATDEDLDDPAGATLAALVMPDLDVPITRRTMRFVHYFARTDEGRAAFLRRYRRAGAYRELIERALREAGLPEDLLWVAAIESGFDPRAVSPAGAAGLWQFMPRTGEAYGLHRSEWVDERMSLARATNAAAAHLRDLYERFGRWDLALAAYNLGHEGVLRALAKVAAERDPDERGPLGHAELAQARAVPEETADYVPKIVAFALVAANRTRFGLDLPDVAPLAPLELGEVAVPAGTRLRTLARAAGVSTALLREHNPELLRDRIPPTGGDYLVALPADRVSRAMALLPAYLDHEALEVGDGAAPLEASAGLSPAMLSSGDVIAAAALDGAPLPRRPASLGRNRLPLFAPPGQAPAPMPLLGNPESLEARLPVMMIGSGIGWRPAYEHDPLGILSGRVIPASAFSAGTAAGALKGREAAIDKQLGFLAELGRERLQRFRLPSGVAVDLREDPAAPLVSISARLAGPDSALPTVGADGARPAGPGRPAGDAGRAELVLAGEARVSITVPPRDLDVGIELVAARLRMLLGEASAGRLAELRRQASASARRALEQAPYGRAWLALGEALFPVGHPLEGAVIGARDDRTAASELMLTELLRLERSADRATISISGDVTRSAVERALARSLQRVSDPAQPVGRHPREERIVIEDVVPAPRLLYGWIAPPEGGPDEAALRVAMAILIDPRIARLAKALAAEGPLVSEVTGRLSLGPQASVAALELAPSSSPRAAEPPQAAAEPPQAAAEPPQAVAEPPQAVAKPSQAAAEPPQAVAAAAGPLQAAAELSQHAAEPLDIAAIERRLEAELTSLAVSGPTWKELSLAKALLKLDLEREISARPGPSASRPVTGLRLRAALEPGSVERLLQAIEEVEPAAVRAVVARTFSRDHRVGIVTLPRSQNALATADAVAPAR